MINKKYLLLNILLFVLAIGKAQSTSRKQQFEPFIWESEPPANCPFEKSEELVGIAFLGQHSDYHLGDTWYPSWASNGKLYSPYTDGSCPRLDGGQDLSISDQGWREWRKTATTGQAVMEGDDPLNLKIYSLGTERASADPYEGRYPCGSLIYNGVWYYGTYCLGPKSHTLYGGQEFNWPWMGPFVGFRISTDYGRSWQRTPHTPQDPIFNESGRWGNPVKIGAPHFVDFGKNMEHSPDGKAYLVAHGAEADDNKWRFGNLSWVSADQIYLLRVTPTVENINDSSKYEFFAGYDQNNQPTWTKDFQKIAPLIEWNNNCGCVTMTYNNYLDKYLMCITDGWPTTGKMDTYILESDKITGPFKLVTYMKNFGEQAYFVNFPSKFIQNDGYTAWLCYSGNFTENWGGKKIKENPPGSHYGLVLQKVRLLSKKMLKNFNK